MSKEITPVIVTPDVNLPSLKVNVSIDQKKELIQAQAVNIDKICEEVLDDIRKDREQHIDVTKSLLDMVINDGDASNSSKEALVSLMKNLSDLSDKKIKVMELLVKAYLKDSNTFPKYLAAHQHNEINIDRRAMIQSLKEPKEKVK